MRFVYAWAFLASVWAASGCATAWPEVGGIVYPDLAAMGGVRSVEILAPDVDLAVAAGVEDAPDTIAARFSNVAGQAMAAELSRRGYVNAEDSEAVLELGGFAYAGKEENKAAEILVGVFLILVIVGLAVLAVRNANHGGGGGHGHASGLRFAHIGFRIAGAFSANTPWPAPGPLPENGPSHSDLELRLVDRETGRLLWRAFADMPADPRRPDEVTEAIARLAASMPHAARRRSDARMPETRP